MGTNVRLRMVAVLYLVLALISAWIFFLAITDNGGDHGLSKNMIAFLSGSFALITGALGFGLWNVAEVARVMALVLHWLMLVFNIILLITGIGLVFNLVMIAIQAALIAVLYHSEPEISDTDAPSEFDNKSLGQILLSPNTRLRAIAAVYMLATVCLIFLLGIVLLIALLGSQGDFGPNPWLVALVLVMITPVIASLGLGLWKLYDSVRWIVLVLHVIWLLFNLSALLEGRDFSSAFMAFTANLVIIGILYFSEPEYAY
jgi:hypothetical protein